MNRLEEMNITVIHTTMVSGREIMMTFYTGSTLREALDNLILDGSTEEVLDYAPAYALSEFRSKMLCMSRSEKDFVYIEKVEDETRMAEFMDRFFDDSMDGFSSLAALQGFIADYNEAGMAIPDISDEEKEDLLDEYRRLADTVWNCNMKFNVKEQAKYVLQHIDEKDTSDFLLHWMRYCMQIVDADQESITACLRGVLNEKEEFIARRNEAETLLNEMMKANFPLDYRYRRLVFLTEDRKTCRREIKIVTINEGNKKPVRSEPWFTVTESKKTAECIQEYLQDGWKILQCFPDFNPAIQEEGSYSFYKGGFTFVLERDL